jgi:hypothetical protein
LFYLLLIELGNSTNQTNQPTKQAIMTSNHRVQEFGSEIEDMLSSEISIDRLYTTAVNDHFTIKAHRVSKQNV